MAKGIRMQVSPKLAKKIKQEKDMLIISEKQKKSGKRKKRITIIEACDSLLEKIL